MKFQRPAVNMETLLDGKFVVDQYGNIVCHKSQFNEYKQVMDKSKGIGNGFGMDVLGNKYRNDGTYIGRIPGKNAFENAYKETMQRQQQQQQSSGGWGGGSNASSQSSGGWGSGGNASSSNWGAENTQSSGSTWGSGANTSTPTTSQSSGSSWGAGSAQAKPSTSNWDAGTTTENEMFGGQKYSGTDLDIPKDKMGKGIIAPADDVSTLTHSQKLYDEPINLGVKATTKTFVNDFEEELWKLNLDTGDQTTLVTVARHVDCAVKDPAKWISALETFKVEPSVPSRQLEELFHRMAFCQIEADVGTPPTFTNIIEELVAAAQEVPEAKDGYLRVLNSIKLSQKDINVKVIEDCAKEVDVATAKRTAFRKMKYGYSCAVLISDQHQLCVDVDEMIPNQEAIVPEECALGQLLNGIPGKKLLAAEADLMELFIMGQRIVVKNVLDVWSVVKV